VFGVTMARSAILSSNSGDERLELTPSGVIDGKAERSVICDIELIGKHWGCSDENPVKVIARQVPLPISAISAAIRDARSWLELPLVEQGRTPINMELNLSDHFTLALGLSDRLLVSQNFAATISLNLGTWKLETYYVTDQSCVSEFCDGLKMIVEKYDESGT